MGKNWRNNDPIIRRTQYTKSINTTEETNLNLEEKTKDEEKIQNNNIVRKRINGAQHVSLRECFNIKTIRVAAVFDLLDIIRVVIIALIIIKLHVTTKAPIKLS